MQLLSKNLYSLGLLTVLMAAALAGSAEAAHQQGHDTVPSLVTKASPGPEVIYNKGSRDAILISNDGLIEGNMDGAIETPITQKVRDLDNAYQGLVQTSQNYQQRLAELQSRSDAAAARYFAMMARINTELQSGTTPGNPILVGLWNDAQNQLDIMSGLASNLNTVASELAAESTKAAFLQDNIRATYSLSGAVKRDHVRLRQVEDDVTQAIVVLNRLLTQTGDEMNRRQATLRTEKLNLQTAALSISNGELYGQNLSNSLFRKATVEGAVLPQKPAVTTYEAPASEMPASGEKNVKAAQPMAEDLPAPVAVTKTTRTYESRTASMQTQNILPATAAVKTTVASSSPANFVGGRKPVVIIRFDRPGVNYEQPLYTAVNAVLDRFPGAQFDLVAVSTTKGNTAEQALSSSDARKNGEAVLRSLSQMGLPLERVHLNAASSQSVNNSEVHIYMQ